MHYECEGGGVSVEYRHAPSSSRVFTDGRARASDIFLKYGQSVAIKISGFFHDFDLDSTVRRVVGLSTYT